MHSISGSKIQLKNKKKNQKKKKTKKKKKTTDINVNRSYFGTSHLNFQISNDAF